MSDFQAKLRGSIVASAAAAILIYSAPAAFGTDVSFTAVESGEATDSSALVWTHVEGAATAPVALTVQVSRFENFVNVEKTLHIHANPANDYTAKVLVTGLHNNEKYYYRFLSSTGVLSPVGRFVTAIPENKNVETVKFAFSGDADGHWRPYGSTLGFSQLDLDFFVWLGD